MGNSDDSKNPAQKAERSLQKYHTAREGLDQYSRSLASPPVAQPQLKISAVMPVANIAPETPPAQSVRATSDSRYSSSSKEGQGPSPKSAPPPPPPPAQSDQLSAGAPSQTSSNESSPEEPRRGFLGLTPREHGLVEGMVGYKDVTEFNGKLIRQTPQGSMETNQLMRTIYPPEKVPEKVLKEHVKDNNKVFDALQKIDALDEYEAIQKKDGTYKIMVYNNKVYHKRDEISLRREEVEAATRLPGGTQGRSSSASHESKHTDMLGIALGSIASVEHPRTPEDKGKGISR